MEPTHYVLVAFASLLAGALNAVAGGGTFFTFPALLYAGVPPILANTTSKVGLWIGALGSIRGFRQEIAAQKNTLAATLLISALGSIAGSVTLLYIPQEQFRTLIPWLLLVATCLFATSGKLKKLGDIQHPNPSKPLRAGELSIAFYAGFFGAGIGILLIALFSLSGMRDIHLMNGRKVIFAVVAHSVSASIFIVSGALHWPLALLIMGCSAVGGYYGAYASKLIPQSKLRLLILIYCVAVTSYFFLKTYSGTSQ